MHSWFARALAVLLAGLFIFAGSIGLAARLNVRIAQDELSGRFCRTLTTTLSACRASDAARLDREEATVCRDAVVRERETAIQAITIERDALLRERDAAINVMKAEAESWRSQCGRLTDSLIKAAREETSARVEFQELCVREQTAVRAAVEAKEQVADLERAKATLVSRVTTAQSELHNLQRQAASTPEPPASSTWQRQVNAVLNVEKVASNSPPAASLPPPLTSEAVLASLRGGDDSGSATTWLGFGRSPTHTPTLTAGMLLVLGCDRHLFLVHARGGVAQFRVVEDGRRTAQFELRPGQTRRVSTSAGPATLRVLQINSRGSVNVRVDPDRK